MPQTDAVLTSSSQKKAGFAEICYVCGAFSLFSSTQGNLREAQCALCGSTKRISDVARTISAHFGPSSDEPQPLPSILEYLATVSIFEAQASGPLHNLLASLSGYVCGELLDGVPPGTMKGGIRCEDLTKLTFADGTFDLIVTQDVLEHVPLFEQAFTEISRVLKPGGKHIFTVPINPAHPTSRRIWLEGGENLSQILPPVYHGDPLRAEGALVAVDYGNDIIDILRRFDFSTSVFEGGDWYASDEITWIDSPQAYERYRAGVRERGMLEFFRYNSLVFVSEKIALPFTGERFVPELKGQIAHEHLHRYAMAREYVQGKDVLDIACGEGYGSNLLAERASLVIGVDISEQAIRHAESKYADRSNLRFFKGTCTDIPSPECAFDVVVSFETIEHIEQQEGFLQEVRRVLKQDGLFIVSSPNADEYMHGNAEKNPFHQKELTREGFQSLLAKYFVRIDLYGQRLSTNSQVWPIQERDSVAFAAYKKDPDGIVRQGVLPVQPEYFIAVCAPTDRALTPEASVFHDALDDITREFHARGVWGQSLEKELRACQAELVRLKGGNGERGGRPDRASRREKAGSLLQAGRLDEGVALLQTLISEKPDDTEVLLDLASICIRMRDLSNASLLLNRALSSDPVNRRAMELFRDLSIRETSQDNASLPLDLIRVTSLEAHIAGETARREVVEERGRAEQSLIGSGEAFTVSGHCYVCNEDVEFRVDVPLQKNGDAPPSPNWRESLHCPSCGLNNRMRAAIHVLEKLKAPGRNEKIFIAEQTTPLFRTLSSRYLNVVGSEFLGKDHRPGSVSPGGIRHEDLTELSFPDGSFDRVLTFDVLEHVPDYKKALAECYRVTAPGGMFLFSVPFERTVEHTIIRAVEHADGAIEHLLPAEYHGDPVNPGQGCLCYQVFGWDILDELERVGFAHPAALMYWSQEYGYLGGEQILFIGTKPVISPPGETRKQSGISMAPIPLWDRDQQFNSAMAQIPFTLVDRQRCFMLFQFAAQCKHVEGHVAEVGVYKGGTAKLLAIVFADSSKSVHLFDTFAGMPETDATRDMHHQGDFADTSLASVQHLIGNTEQVRFYPGFFPATAGPIEELRFSFVHIDVDIYRSVLDCSEFFYGRMNRGGMMVYDHYGFESCPGAKQAVDEFFADKQERPWYLPTGQCVIVKL